MAKRGDYEYNHWKLAEAYKAFVKQWRRTPTARELAEDCELDEKTVRTHLKKMRFVAKEHPARILTNDIINALASKALSGDLAAFDRWMQVMEEYVPKQEIRHADAKGKRLKSVTIRVINGQGNSTENNSG
ncbi:MAG: hypothetical protein EKK55_15605 [Rhodocyclaceae bacterium]|nr:MAG: hypothetical protein EKK55_15605 [Rhodocyclaceae bacterium]